MLRVAAILLLIANLAYFAWTQGYLSPVGLVPQAIQVDLAQR